MSTVSEMHSTPVIYVAGNVRSGSTVLNAVLGEHPDIIACGELSKLAGSGWLRNEYCSCGATAERCPFWREVYQRWRTKCGADARELFALQERFDRRRRWLHRSIVQKPGLAQFLLYEKQTVALYQSLREVSGKQYVVDSSKRPSRGVSLSKMRGIKMYVIHMVRDGRGVCWSLKKRFPKDRRAGVQKTIHGRSTIKTARSWTLTDEKVERLRGRMRAEDSVLVRYEDLVYDPVDTLKQIGEVIGCDMSDPIQAVVGQAGLHTRHVIAGNRVRMQERICLRPDEEWRSELPNVHRRLFELLAMRGLKKYGYVE